MLSSRSKRHIEWHIWPGFVDVALMVILILVVFFFAQIIANTDAWALAEIREKQKRIESLIQGLLDEQALEAIQFRNDFKTQQITFSDRILFESGRAELQPTGKAVLAVIAQVLKEHQGLFDRIQIEGHTDKIPVLPGGPFRSNWDLSSSRATAVVEYFDLKGMDPARVPMSAAGFSKYRPAAGYNEDDLGRNRRIEIVLYYSAE